MGEGLAVARPAVEGEEDRTDGVAGAAVGDHHVGDRLGVVGDRLPDAEPVEHAPAGRRDRRGAVVAGDRLGRSGVDHRDREVGRGRSQGQRQRQADMAAAGDQHVGAIRVPVDLASLADICYHRVSTATVLAATPGSPKLR